MAGFAGYTVFVEYIMKTAKLAQGMRQVQANVRSAQANVTRMGKMTEEHAKRLQKAVTYYGSIYGSPKTYAEAKRQMADIQKKHQEFAKKAATTANAGYKSQLMTQMAALKLTEDDVKAKAKSLYLTEKQADTQKRAADRQAAFQASFAKRQEQMIDREARSQQRASEAFLRGRQRMAVGEARSQLRISQAADAEKRRFRSNASSVFGGIAGNAFGVAQGSGLASLAILGGLFGAGNMASDQMQAAGQTFLDLGFDVKNKALANNVMNQLMQSALDVSMKVGQLSSGDVATVQKIITQHLALTGQAGLKQLIQGYTLPIAQYADVMRLTTGESVETSAALATRAANVLGLGKSPDELKRALQSIFVMEESTGAPQDRFLRALGYFGAVGRQTGYSPEDLIALYGESYRLGIGSGHSGQRLQRLITQLGNIPTTAAQRTWGQLYGEGAMGIPFADLMKNGQMDMFTTLAYLGGARNKLVAKYGDKMGERLFVNALQKGGFGQVAQSVGASLTSPDALQAWMKQQQRQQRFSSLEAAQQFFLGLPQGEMARFKTNLSSFLIEFGMHGLPFMTSFFHHFANILDSATRWMAANPVATDRAFKGLATLGALFGALAGFAGTVGIIASIGKNLITFAGWFHKFESLFEVGGPAVRIFVGLGRLAAPFAAGGSVTDIIAGFSALAGGIEAIVGALAALGIIQLNKTLNPSGSMNLGPESWDLTTGWYPGAPTPVGMPKWPLGSLMPEQKIIVQIDGKTVATQMVKHVNKNSRQARYSTTTSQSTPWSPEGALINRLGLPNPPHSR